MGTNWLKLNPNMSEAMLGYITQGSGRSDNSLLEIMLTFLLLGPVEFWMFK